MANQYNPNDPYRTGQSDDEYYRSRLEREAQIDPELAEGPASPGRIALFAVGIALVLGVVFYGLNRTSTNEASTTPPAQTAQTQPASPQAPPGMRDVTPRAPNSQPGTTTGAATNRPTLQPPSSSSGSDLDRAANPQAGQNNDNR
jgi:hypothetical protein